MIICVIFILHFFAVSYIFCYQLMVLFMQYFVEVSKTNAYKCEVTEIIYVSSMGILNLGQQFCPYLHFDVRKLQVAILARSPREISQTDRILPRYILSRVRISVRPIIFLYMKKPQTRLARMLFISSHWICSAAR